MIRIIFLALSAGIIVSFFIGIILWGYISFNEQAPLDENKEYIQDTRLNNPNFFCSQNSDCAVLEFKDQCGAHRGCFNKNAQFPEPRKDEGLSCVFGSVNPPEGFVCKCVQSICDYSK